MKLVNSKGKTINTMASKVIRRFIAEHELYRSLDIKTQLKMMRNGTYTPFTNEKKLSESIVRGMLKEGNTLYFPDGSTMRVASVDRKRQILFPTEALPVDHQFEKISVKQALNILR